MTREYLGETVVGSVEEFDGYGTAYWIMYFIERYSQIDGYHHKLWVLDQIARILKGTPVIVKEARWSDGLRELRVSLGGASSEYLAWVENMKAGEDGPDTYDYDCGIAP